MKNLYTLIFIFFLGTTLFAQNNVGINTTNPDASAALDITSATQGILVPRLTLDQRNVINMVGGTSTPATGLLIFQTDNTPGFYFYNGTSWTALNGINGANGANGQGVPTGGSAGQVLSKIDNLNYNTQWTTPASGTALPSQSGNAGKFLTTDGTNTSWAGASGASLQLFATSTNTQAKTPYAFSRYTFNFNNILSGASTSAWTNNNTFTVPNGLTGVYNINLAIILSNYTGFTNYSVAPEIQIKRGNTIAYYYGSAGNFSTLYAGDQTDATSAIPAANDFKSYSRGTLNITLPLQEGDMIKVFYRGSASATASSYSVSFTTDGSTYLSIVKLN